LKLGKILRPFTLVLFSFRSCP